MTIQRFVTVRLYNPVGKNNGVRFKISDGPLVRPRWRTCKNDAWSFNDVYNAVRDVLEKAVYGKVTYIDHEWLESCGCYVVSVEVSDKE